MANIGTPRRMGERLRSAVAGASIGANVLASTAMTATAASVVGVLASSKVAVAQERVQNCFSTYKQALDYARKNGYVMVNTGINGTVFISQSSFDKLKATPGFEVRTNETGINYVTSSSPNMRARITDETIIGGKDVRIIIDEERGGGDDEERGGGDNDRDNTPTSTPTPDKGFTPGGGRTSDL